MIVRRRAVTTVLAFAVAVTALAACSPPGASSGASSAPEPATRVLAAGPTEEQASLLAAAQEVVDAHPTVLGSVFLDPARGQVTVRSAPGVAAADARAALSTASDAGVRVLPVVPGALSAAKISAVLEDVYGVPLPGGTAVYSAAYDAADDVVRVEVNTPDPAARAALAATLTDAITLVAGTPVGAGASEADMLFPTGRYYARSPFPGGAAFVAKSTVTASPRGGCTTGFSWRTAAGASRMITAGHCFPAGTVVDQAFTHRNGPGSPQWNVFMGTALASTFRNETGTISYNGAQRGDLAILAVTSSGSSGPTIYVDNGSGGYKQLYVIGTATRRPAVGDAFCMSGAYRGETCGWRVTSTNASYWNGGILGWMSNGHLTNLVLGERNGTCPHAGDSGSPVYTKNSVPRVIAKGIYSGGGGGFPVSCKAYFTPIQNATDAFGGKIAQL